MKKLILIFAIFIIGFTVTAQTDYSPTIMTVDIPYPGTTDVIHRSVKMNMTGWDNMKMKIHLTRYEWMNDQSPHLVVDFTLDQFMDSVYVHERDNGNQITNTGRWFVQVVFEGGAIDWDLWKELGRSIYFMYWDTSEQYFVKP